MIEILKNSPGAIDDLSEFLNREIENSSINYDKPLELQGVIDSMETLQYIIYLEKKYNKRLLKEQIQSIENYIDLISLFDDK